MNPLYNLGIHTMSGACRLAGLRSPKIADMLVGQRQTFDKLRQSKPGYDLWVHAASLGEFEQARPVIEAFKAARPDARVLVSFFSPSGYKVRCNYPLADCVVYLPFDTPRKVRRFLDLARPEVAVFVKYEFWGNYLTQLERRGIPSYLISSIFRPSQAFFKPWGMTFRRMLRCYSHIFVQDDPSAKLLASIGIDNVTVAGDTRFDRVADIVKAAKRVPALEKWLAASDGPDASDASESSESSESSEGSNHTNSSDDNFTLVVGSSWQQDEALYIPWLNAHPDVRAIIAPHEFDSARIDALRHAFNAKVTLWSETDNGSKDIPADTKILIIDCIGMLSRLYRYGDAALIGGGLGAGIHNINEAAAYSIPVAFGPNHRKFKEALDLIGMSGAPAQSYSDAATLCTILDGWLADAEARRRAGKVAGAYISAHTGATERIMPKVLNSL